MEFDRKRGAGRWAEIVGESAVGQDKLMRRFRLEDSARADYQASSPETREMFDAYASGINAFIGSDSPLPVEYQIIGLEPEPWQPWHGLVVYKVRHILMGCSSLRSGGPRWWPNWGRRKHPICSQVSSPAIP